MSAGPFRRAYRRRAFRRGLPKRVRRARKLLLKRVLRLSRRQIGMLTSGAYRMTGGYRFVRVPDELDPGESLKLDRALYVRMLRLGRAS